MKLQLLLPFSPDDLSCDQREYLLIASPTPNVTAKVMEVKEDFYAVYKQAMAVTTRPHITVAAFKATEKLQSSVIELMQQACHDQQRFVVALRGFDGFAPAAIYIKVQDHQPFRQLAHRLRTVNGWLQNNGCRTAKLVNLPHLTIARRLSSPVYKKAIQDYSNRSFRDAFVLNNLLLLKRRHPGDHYKRVTSLRFSPAPHF